MSTDELFDRMAMRYQRQGLTTAGTLGDSQTREFEGRRWRHECRKSDYIAGRWFLRCWICGHIEDFPGAPRYMRGRLVAAPSAGESSMEAFES